MSTAIGMKVQSVPRQIAGIQGVAVEHDNARGSGIHGGIWRFEVRVVNSLPLR